VSTNAVGAQILLDGQDTGVRTPAMLKGISPGEHHVVARTECARASATVNVRQDLIERAELQLQVGDGALMVSSEPEGATVYLDGEQVGTTPYVAKAVPCDSHRIELRAPGYLSVSQTLRVPANETTTVELVLEQERFGTLVVAPMPLEASILLDGIEAGTGPMTLEQVGAGEHELLVALAGHVPDMRTIDVLADEVTRVDVTLAPAEAAPAPSLPWGRLALDTVVTAGGVGLGVAAVVTYAGARQRYDEFLAEPDDAIADEMYENEVRPARTAAALEAVGAAALLGTGIALWATTDLGVSVRPGGLAIQGRW